MIEPRTGRRPYQRRVGILGAVPRDEWVTGRAMASVVMAAYCTAARRRPVQQCGARRVVRSAHARDGAGRTSIYHRNEELRQVGGFERGSRCASTSRISRASSTTSAKCPAVSARPRGRRCITPRLHGFAATGPPAPRRGGQRSRLRACVIRQGSAWHAFARVSFATSGREGNYEYRGEGGRSPRCGGSELSIDDLR